MYARVVDRAARLAAYGFATGIAASSRAGDSAGAMFISQFIDDLRSPLLNESVRDIDSAMANEDVRTVVANFDSLMIPVDIRDAIKSCILYNI
jgi:hypothetical protein